LSELPNVKNSDFICIVGAGDQLPVDALARIARIMCRDSPDIIYADEAQLQSNGVDLRRLNLRTAFNLDGFLSAPTLGFFTLTRIETLDINKPVPSVDAFALNEWLLLNALRQADKVIHLPEVLYLLASVQRPTSRLAPQFFREFLQGRGFSDACVTPTATPGCRAVRYQIPSQGKTAIIIPTHDRVDLLQAAVDSLLATTSNDTVELIVVDHESNEPGTLEYLESLAKEHTVIRYTGLFNFSRINNLAVSYVSDRCDTVLFLNNDIEAITPDWLQSMLDKARRPDVGVVGATLLYPDNRIQHAGVIMALGVADHFMEEMPYASPYQQDLSTAVLPWIVTREFSAVTAACLAMRKSVFQDIGGFDEKLAVGFQDIDLCLRLKQQGYRVLCDGEAVLIHHTSATRSTSDNQALADSLDDPIFRLHLGDPHFEDTALFSTRYQALLNRADPFYHPLLSRLTHYYRLSRGARRPVVPDARSITLNLEH
jgi:GT2 family glycosyltransferase